MKKIFNIIIVGVFALLMGACNDGFEEMNVHPQKPTQTQPDFLFTNLIRGINYNGGQFLYLYGPQTEPVIRMVSVSPGNMDILNNQSGIDASWSEYYLKLRDINALQEQLDNSLVAPERLVNQKAMLTIFKIAYAFKVLDKFGNVPMTEAGKGYSDLLFRPVYDNQEQAYVALLDELKAAVSSMVLADKTAAEEDIFDFEINNRLWRGSEDADVHFTKWKQFGNSLILKHALRMSKADEGKAKEYITFALQGPLMGSIEDGAALIPTRIDGYGNNSRKIGVAWARRYGPSIRPSRFLASLMSNSTDPEYVDSTQVVDPRFYGIFWPTSDGEYRILPTSPDDRIGLDTHINDGENYPGGESDKDLPWWDDSDYKANYCTFNRFYSMSIFMPQQILSYSEHCLILAEIYEMGLASGNAKEFYEKGIRASITEFLDPAHGQYPDKNPHMITEVTDDILDAVIADPMIDYDQVSNKLDAIRTQRYLDYFNRADQAWAVVRRTNLFNFDVNVPIVEDGRTVEMIYRLKYPGNEISYNTDNYLEALGRMGGQDDIRYKNWLWK